MSESSSKARKLTLVAVIIGIAYLVLQHSIYLLGHTLAGVVNITPILPKIPAIDNLFPIVSIFIIPYIWSYIFWAMGPMAVAKCEQNHYKDYLVATVVALFVGGAILVFVPTYMDRVAEGLFSVKGTGVFDQLRQYWYSLDGSEMAYNLFPSFHCLNSALCYLGVAGRKELPKWFRVYTFIMMILIFLSTLYVKQHFVMDVVSGITIAVVVFSLAKKFHWGRIIKFNI